MNKRTVLVVEDDWKSAKELEARLADAGYETHVASDGYAALSKARVVLPDLILLDVAIRGLRAMEIKNRLAQEESTNHIPICFILDGAPLEEKVKEFILRADGHISKPFDFKEILTRVDAIANRRRLYEQTYMTDPMTRLSNVHVFKRTFEALFNVARRYGRPFSLAVIDLNDFKTVNDTYGHAVGDAILSAFADAMRKIFRDTDILVRYGGDEFVVLFPETDETQAAEALRRLDGAVKEIQVPVREGGRSVGFTISSGIASYQKNFKQPDELFRLADERMYAHKSQNKAQKKPIFSNSNSNKSSKLR